MELKERLVKLANEKPELRAKIIPLLKTAGWESTNVKAGTRITDRMIEALVIRKAEYLGVVKGSVKWSNKPKHNTLDFSVGWDWHMKGIDPDTSEEYIIAGQFKVRMEMDKSYRAWIGVHV